MFGDLVALEQHRRTLREKAIGGDAVRNIFRRAAKVPAEVTARAGLARGDAVLARGRGRRRHLAARHPRRLVLVPGRAREARPGSRPRTIPWERVESADWDRDESRLRVSEVADFGRERPVHVLDRPRAGVAAADGARAGDRQRAAAAPGRWSAAAAG